MQGEANSLEGIALTQTYRHRLTADAAFCELLENRQRLFPERAADGDAECAEFDARGQGLSPFFGERRVDFHDAFRKLATLG